MRRTLSSTIMFLLCLCLVGTVFAQSGKGSLSGRVADSADAVLHGAQVELLPRAATVTTNERGEFNITNLDPGTYTVMISYVGFEPFTRDVTIAAGKNTQLKAVISIQSRNDEVTVLSERQSAEAEAINRTRAAENILQVLPADVIMSLPNANIADALGRMPSVTIERDEGEGKYVQIRGTEPRLSNVTIDGITIPSPERGVRQIKLDTIGSDLVDSVEINKSLQANIDADGIGGSVNLRTKTAGEAPTVSLFGVGGYTPIKENGRASNQFGGTLGQRFGAQKKLGVLIGSTYDFNGRGIDDIEPVPTTNSLTPHYDSMDLRDYVYSRTRWGATGSVDYKLGEGSGIYLRGLYSNFRNWGQKSILTLNNNILDSNNKPPPGGTPSTALTLHRPNFAIGNLVGGGKHVFSNSWFAWDASVGRSRSKGGYGYANYGWVGDPLIPCFNDQSQATSVNRPGWSKGCYGTGADNVLDRNNYGLSGFSLPTFGQSVQLNLQASASYAKNYHAGSHFGTLEVGGKIRNAHKFDDTYNEGWSAPTDTNNIPIIDQSLYISQHPEWDSNYKNTNFYDKTYKVGTVTDFSNVRSWAMANLPLTRDPVSDLANNFDLIERISAGYVMNSIDLSPRVRLVTGLRFEATHVDTLSYDNNQPLLKLTYHAGGDYLDVLPSGSLRFALNKDSNLRLVYGRGLARPDPQDITSAVSQIDKSLQHPPVDIGNPSLKAEHANNYDVLYERYLKPLGLIQVGYFYKDLSDPIVKILTRPTTGPFAGDLVTQPVNAGTAHVQGVEFGYQQHLSFLPGMLGGLGISTNYSYTTSQASGVDPLRTDKPALLRQAPNTWNISPTFDNKHISLRFGMTYNGPMIYQYHYENLTADATTGSNVPVDPTTQPLGAKGPAGDTYLYSHYQMDVQGSYKMGRSFSVYAYGLNLNNEVFGFYNGSPQYVVQREYYKPTYAAGIRYNFTRDR